MRLSIVDIARPPQNGTVDGTTLNTENGTEGGSSLQSVTIPTVAIIGPKAIFPEVSGKTEQPWAAALALVQSAARQMQRYEQSFRSMANDVVKVTFRLVAEKAALEQSIEEVDKKLDALSHEHQLTLDLLNESHALCLSLTSRLEKFEAIPPELEREIHYTSRYIAKIRRAASRRPSLGGHVAGSHNAGLEHHILAKSSVSSEFENAASPRDFVP